MPVATRLTRSTAAATRHSLRPLTVRIQATGKAAPRYQNWNSLVLSHADGWVITTLANAKRRKKGTMKRTSPSSLA